MTHEQKAKEIVEMFEGWTVSSADAKDVSLIYIDGKIECLGKVTGNMPMRSEIINSWTDTDSEIQDWKLVKMEVEKL